MTLCYRMQGKYTGYKNVKLYRKLEKSISLESFYIVIKPNKGDTLSTVRYSTTD